MTETKNVSFAYHPWVKRSWIHRLVFEAVAARIAAQHNAAIIISLQNIAIWHARVPQAVFVHQSLPYSGERYSALREPKLWAYQHLISRLISRSIQSADLVAVQSNWMMQLILRDLPGAVEKIQVVPPFKHPPQSSPRLAPTKEERSTFFYPSDFNPYKNHGVIAEACRLLTRSTRTDFRVELTIDQKSLRSLTASGLPCLQAIGRLDLEETQRRYHKSILLYPSKLESYGLPLAEARRCGAIIISADTPVAQEVLREYPNAHFFDPDDAHSLAEIMKAAIDGSLEYKSVEPYQLIPPQDAERPSLADLVKRVIQESEEHRPAKRRKRVHVGQAR